MVTLEEIYEEIKCFLKKLFDETEAKIKIRLKRMLLYGIIIGVLVAVLTSLFGSGVFFFLIGSILYLYTFLPLWLAIMIMGINAVVIGVVILLVIYIILRKKLGTNKNTPNQK